MWSQIRDAEADDRREHEGRSVRLFGMIEADRVAIVGWIWFIAWTLAGDAVGRWLFACPGTGLVWGFLIALATLPAWPWIMPPALDDWMHELPPVSQPRHPWRAHVRTEAFYWSEPAGTHGRDLRRVAFVAALWFVFWMAAGAVIGGLLSKPGLAIEGIYSGIFNGGWLALLTSFVWPWFMPSAVDRWMYRSQIG
jgi:hypothetical protein